MRGYRYMEERPIMFTDDGQRMFLAIRDHTKRLLALSGAATLGKMISVATGDSFHAMACVDRMVELGEIREITPEDSTTGQCRVFVPSGG